MYLANFGHSQIIILNLIKPLTVFSPNVPETHGGLSIACLGLYKLVLCIYSYLLLSTANIDYTDAPLHGGLSYMASILAAVWVDWTFRRRQTKRDPHKAGQMVEL